MGLEHSDRRFAVGLSCDFVVVVVVVHKATGMILHDLYHPDNIERFASPSLRHPLLYSELFGPMVS